MVLGAATIHSSVPSSLGYSTPPPANLILEGVAPMGAVPLTGEAPRGAAPKHSGAVPLSSEAPRGAATKYLGAIHPTGEASLVCTAPKHSDTVSTGVAPLAPMTDEYRARHERALAIALGSSSEGRGRGRARSTQRMLPGRGRGRLSARASSTVCAGPGTRRGRAPFTGRAGPGRGRGITSVRAQPTGREGPGRGRGRASMGAQPTGLAGPGRGRGRASSGRAGPRRGRGRASSEVTIGQDNSNEVCIKELTKNVLSTVDLLFQLQDSELWKSVKEHNRFNSPEILHAHLNETFWDQVRVKILEEISNALLINDKRGLILVNTIAIRSKKYAERKVALLQGLFNFDRPVVSTNENNRFEAEWRSTLYSLGLTFFQLVHKSLPKGNIAKELGNSIKLLLCDNNSTTYFDEIILESIYYISDFLLSCMEKESNRRGGEIIGKWLDVFVYNNECIDSETAKEANLSTG